MVRGVGLRRCVPPNMLGHCKNCSTWHDPEKERETEKRDSVRTRDRHDGGRRQGIETEEERQDREERQCKEYR